MEWQPLWQLLWKEALRDAVIRRLLVTEHDSENHERSGQEWRPAEEAPASTCQVPLGGVRILGKCVWFWRSSKSTTNVQLSLKPLINVQHPPDLLLSPLCSFGIKAYKPVPIHRLLNITIGNCRLVRNALGIRRSGLRAILATTPKPTSSLWNSYKAHQDVFWYRAWFCFIVLSAWVTSHFVTKFSE